MSRAWILLVDGVHVAEAALEFVGAEHGGGARHVIGGIDHRCRLMDGPGRGQAERDAMGLGEAVAALQIAPHFGGGGIEIGARGAQIGFGAPDQALHRAVLAHRRKTLRLLAARQLDGGIQRGAGDAERGRGKAHAEHHVGGEPVKRPPFAQRRGSSRSAANLSAMNRLSTE